MLTVSSSIWKFVERKVLIAVRRSHLLCGLLKPRFNYANSLKSHCGIYSGPTTGKPDCRPPRPSAFIRRSTHSRNDGTTIASELLLACRSVHPADYYKHEAILDRRSRWPLIANYMPDGVQKRHPVIS